MMSVMTRGVMIKSRLKKRKFNNVIEDDGFSSGETATSSMRPRGHYYY